jgi:hypothetical protein
MKKYYYSLFEQEYCKCCGRFGEPSVSNDYTSFSEARDALLDVGGPVPESDEYQDWNCTLTTNDPIAKYYIDDPRIIYKGE